VLWPCEDNNNNNTDQRWELLEDGQLRNMLSGKCAVQKVLDQAAASRPTLVIGPCDQSAAGIWEQTPKGFIRNVGTGRCINVVGLPGIEDGSLIDTWACQHVGILVPGTWTLDSRGFIVNIGLDEDAIRHSSRASIETSMYRCIEVWGEEWMDAGKASDGAALWLDYCKINTDQKWEITAGGFIRNVIGGQKCLSVMHKTHYANPLVPKLWIDNCFDKADPALFTSMKWEQASAGMVRNKFSKKCMAWSSDGKPTTNHGLTQKERAIIQMPCDDPEAEKTWDFTPNGTVISRISGHCLDFGGPPLAKYPPLAVQACEAGKESQQWELSSEGFLRNKVKSLCVGTLIDKPSLDNILLILEECPDDSQHRWEMLPDGQIRNMASGSCLDEPRDDQFTQPYELTLWTCDPARAAQRWDKIPTPMVEVE